MTRIPGFVWALSIIATEMVLLSGGFSMNVIFILLGLVLIVGGWVSGLVRDGYSAPQGRLFAGPVVAMALGAVCLVAGIVRSF